MSSGLAAPTMASNRRSCSPAWASRRRSIRSPARVSISDTLRRSVFGAVALSAVAVAGFGLAPTAAVAGAALVVAGFGGVGFLSRGNGLVQEIVPDRLRGRVMSLWVLVFIGGMALGGALLGWAAEAFDPRAAVAGSGVACLVLSAALWLSLPTVRTVES